MSDSGPEAKPLPSRRTVLLGGVGVVGAAALWGCTSSNKTSSSGTAGQPDARTAKEDGWFEPEVLQSKNGLLEVTLQAAPGEAVWGGVEVVNAQLFNGAFPGPTLRVSPGDRMKVHFVNDLDKPTNLHTHGFHVSPSGNADNVFIKIDPGKAFDYVFDIPDNHPAGTDWYHPHKHGNVSEQVAHGLSGTIIMEGPLDQVDGIRGVPERLMTLQIAQTDGDKILPTPVATTVATVITAQPRVVLCNGKRDPVLKIRPGETQRWRISSPNYDYLMNLTLDGHMFYVIGNDGQARGQTIAQKQLFLTPGERVDVLVQGGPPGDYKLKTLQTNRGGPTGPPQTQLDEQTIVTVRSEGPAQDKAPLPTELVAFEDLRDQPIAQEYEVVMEVTTNPSTGDVLFLSNGMIWDADQVAQSLKLNEVQKWVVRSGDMSFHNFHIHTNPFQVVEINGAPFDDNGYRDTYPVGPNSSFTMLIKPAKFTGKAVYHCHILNHEDKGMMGNVEFVK